VKLKKALALRIKDLREKAGLSQQDLAVRGDLSQSLVAKLEQGKKADPRASTLLALAEALGVKPGALLDDLFPAPTTPEVKVEELPKIDMEPPTTNGAAHEEKKPKKKKEGKKKSKS
jgi:transcriptional regulator with XRE-family HTH domain